VLLRFSFQVLVVRDNILGNIVFPGGLYVAKPF